MSPDRFSEEQYSETRRTPLEVILPLAAGFNVVANARHVMAAGTLTPSDDLLLVDGDVSEASTVRNLIRSAELRFGRIDVLINNAGIFVPKPFVEYTPEDFHRVISTDFAGFFYVAQEAARHMRQAGGGQIITITTTLAQQPVAGVTAALTSLTKGGLNSVTQGLAIEYVAEGIRVNAIAPGIVDTPMHKLENHESLKGLHPIRRLAMVQEIVDAALFLVGSLHHWRGALRGRRLARGKVVIRMVRPDRIGADHEIVSNLFNNLLIA